MIHECAGCSSCTALACTGLSQVLEEGLLGSEHSGEFSPGVLQKSPVPRPGAYPIQQPS